MVSTLLLGFSRGLIKYFDPAGYEEVDAMWIEACLNETLSSEVEWRGWCDEESLSKWFLFTGFSSFVSFAGATLIGVLCYIAMFLMRPDDTSRDPQVEIAGQCCNSSSALWAMGGTKTEAKAILEKLNSLDEFNNNVRTVWWETDGLLNPGCSELRALLFYAQNVKKTLSEKEKSRLLIEYWVFFSGPIFFSFLLIDLGIIFFLIANATAIRLSYKDFDSIIDGSQNVYLMVLDLQWSVTIICSAVFFFSLFVVFCDLTKEKKNDNRQVFASHEIKPVSD
jgi:hypothetical protein